MSEWIHDTVDQLGQAAEAYEAEAEGLPGTGKKKGKASARTAELMGYIDAHNFHVTQLENLLRALDNDQVSPEEIEEGGVKDALEYFISDHADPDFMDDEELYASFDMQVKEGVKLIEKSLSEKKEEQVSAVCRPRAPRARCRALLPPLALLPAVRLTVAPLLGRRRRRRRTKRRRPPPRPRRRSGRRRRPRRKPPR